MAFKGKNYTRTNVRYSKSYFTRKIWAYEKAIDLGMKTIKGEIGMAIFEPRVPLKDGFYLLDQDITVMGGTHKDFNIHPEWWDVRPKRRSIFFIFIPPIKLTRNYHILVGVSSKR